MGTRRAILTDGTAVNPATGEVLEGLRGEALLEDGKGRRHAKKERRHPVFALVDTRSAARAQMSMRESEVFWYILNSVNPNTGRATLTGSRIAEALEIAQPTVSRILTALADRNIIVRHRNFEIEINPWIAYFGSAEAWESITDDYPTPKWERA